MWLSTFFFRPLVREHLQPMSKYNFWLHMYYILWHKISKVETQWIFIVSPVHFSSHLTKSEDSCHFHLNQILILWLSVAMNSLEFWELKPTHWERAHLWKPSLLSGSTFDVSSHNFKLVIIFKLKLEAFNLNKPSLMLITVLVHCKCRLRLPKLSSRPHSRMGRKTHILKVDFACSYLCTLE